MENKSVENSGIHPLIEVKNLTKIYDNDVRANINIDLKIFKQEIFGIVGPNGAGKTTLVRQMTGELLPTDGEIWIEGIDVIHDPSEVKNIMGVCPQEASLFAYLRVHEHLYYFARIKGLNKEEALERVDKVLKQLNLVPHKNKAIAELSGGLKRKVFVALTILSSPSILFLDEPTTGLDPKSRRDVWHLLRNLRKEKNTTIVLTTHYMEEAESLCDRIIIINNGKIILEGTPDELKNELKYDLKIRAPHTILKKVDGLLSKIDHKIIETGSEVEVYLNREDADKVNLTELITHTYSSGEVIFTKPSLEDVYLEVIRHEDIENSE